MLRTESYIKTSPLPLVTAAKNVAEVVSSVSLIRNNKGLLGFKPSSFLLPC